VSTEDRLLVEAVAKYSGEQSTSAFIRRIVMGAVRLIVERDGADAVLRELLDTETQKIEEAKERYQRVIAMAGIPRGQGQVAGSRQGGSSHATDQGEGSES
jgi:hypothetical protein